MIDFDQNYLDMDDITTRIEQLEVLRQPGPVDTGNPDDADEAQDDLFAELATCEEIVEQLRGMGGDHQWRGDWYPQTLIRESDFADYAQQLAEDTGAIKADAEWPCNRIDWEAAANDLRIDYASIEIRGTEYLYR